MFVSLMYCRTLFLPPASTIQYFSQCRKPVKGLPVAPGERVLGIYISD